jgi:hypothetical protein
MVGDALLGAVASVGGAVGHAISDLFRADGALGATLGGAQVSGQGFKVTKDTVLEAGKIINLQVEALTKTYKSVFRSLRVELAEGSDDVNKQIAVAWNDRLVEGDDSYAGRVEQYLESLSNLINQLRESAEQYGFTDEEVVASLGAKK